MWLAFGSQTRKLRDGEMVVGSGADADWRIATADLMPRHFAITVYDLNASLRASSKDNVVVVNGKQLIGIPHLLNDGDVVAAGAGRFLFSEGTARNEPVSLETAAPMFLVDSAGYGRPLSSRSTMLGRDASSTIVVNDPSVSRFHAEVRREAGGFALHSMGSAGTLLNGRKMSTPLMLTEGDVIEIARRRWRYTDKAPAAAPSGARDNPTGPQWRARAPDTGTVDVVQEPPAPGRRLWTLTVVGIVLVAAVVGFLLATRS